jgi:RimJ/RimL family protein N-acetyltransferase
MQPIFATPRLWLRPVDPSDLAALQRLWNEASVRRYLFDDQPVSRVLASEVLAAQLANRAAGLGLWMVERREDRQLLGCAGLYPVTQAAVHEPAIRGLLEPLAALATAWRGAGHAREALAALLDYGFGELGRAVIAGVTDVPNLESRRMLEALGFELLSETAGPACRQRNYLLRREVWRGRPR